MTCDVEKLGKRVLFFFFFPFLYFFFFLVFSLLLDEYIRRVGRPDQR